MRIPLSKRIFTYVLLVLFALFSLIPLLWAVSTSLKPSNEIFSIPPKWISNNMSLDNYEKVLFASSIPRYFVNSLCVGTITMLLSLFFGGAAGYGFARYKIRGGKGFSLLMLVSQMLPIIVIMIPIYFLTDRLHLIDSLIGLAVSHLFFTLPLVTWMILSYFMGIPRELREAAEIDGCSTLRALFVVELPLAAPGIVATGIYAFVMSWNEFILASVLTLSDKSRTLPIGLSEFSTMFRVDWGSTMAAAILISIPVVILFLWLQKYFISGLTMGSIKG